MKEKLDLTAIIITYNEEKNIRNCIKSIKRFVKDIFVLDSGSKDKTLKILKQNKIRYKINKFKNYSNQYNTAITLSKAKTKWLMRIDADEIVNQDFFKKLKLFIKKISNKTNGIAIKRRYFFLNKEIKYGGRFPHKTLRIWRNNFGKCDNVFMDEKIITKPKVEYLDIAVIDKNNKGFNEWKKKHEKYALWEAINYFKNFKKLKKNKNHIKKYKYYYSIPIFLRPFILFLYNFFFKLGFLDGHIGFKFCLWQTLWFRLTVDKNIYYLKRKNLKNKNILTLINKIDLKYAL